MKKAHQQEKMKPSKRSKKEDQEALLDDKAFKKEYIKRSRKLKYYLLAFVAVTMLAAAVIPVFGLYDEVDPNGDY